MNGRGREERNESQSNATTERRKTIEKEVRKKKDVQNVHVFSLGAGLFFFCGNFILQVATQDDIQEMIDDADLAMKRPHRRAFLAEWSRLE